MNILKNLFKSKKTEPIKVTNDKKTALICPECGEDECISIQITTKEANCGTCHTIWETNIHSIFYILNI